MDFHAAARCMHELRAKGGRAGGAAHQLACDLKTSTSFPSKEHAQLVALAEKVFPSFGTINHGALKELEKMLLRYDDFTREYLVQCLGGNDAGE